MGHIPLKCAGKYITYYLLFVPPCSIGECGHKSSALQYVVTLCRKSSVSVTYSRNSRFIYNSRGKQKRVIFVDAVMKLSFIDVFSL